MIAACRASNGCSTVSRWPTPPLSPISELSILPHHIEAAEAVVDGEIAALDDRGLPSFERLQHRITVADAASVADLGAIDPASSHRGSRGRGGRRDRRAR